MGHIKGDDVKGYSFPSEYVCNECVTPEDLKEIREEEIITGANTDEDDFYFCDRCKKQF